MKEETEVVQENGELGDEVKNLGKGVGVRTIKLKGTPLIEFNLEDNRLIVERICGKHLTNMGKPLGKGVELQAEEAVYMLENGIGLITMKGKYLNLAEAYHFVLQRCNVPFYEYSVYSMLKKHGFVVKRCKLLHQANQKPTTSNDFDTNQQKEETLNGEKSDEKWPNLATGTGLTLRSEALKHLFGQTDGVKIEYTGLMYSPKIRLLNKKPCRPEWLPCLESIKQADNWKTWRDKRKRMMNKKMEQDKKAPTPVAPAAHFDVFVPVTYTHSYPGEPLFRVKCHNMASGPLDLPSIIFDCERLIVGIFDRGMVNFLEITGEPVDLSLIR